MYKKKKNISKNPFFVVVTYYVLVILICTVILKLPFIYNEGQTISWLQSFFTANSAIATTGLSVFDYTEVYNYLGWILMVVMFNVGGMGIIVLNTVISLFVRRKIGFQNRMLAKVDYNQSQQIDIVKVLKSVVLYFLITEFVCIILVFIKVYGNYDSPIESLMNTIFMVSSAISGSGFYNSVPYNTDYFVQGILMLGMIFSFIGYPVIIDIHDLMISKIKKQKFRFSRFTKIAISVNAITVLLFALIFFLFENNNATIGMDNLNIFEKIQWSTYLSLSMKSVGLNLITDINNLQSITLIFMMIFMLIGGSPSSACGGIRIGAIYLIYKHIKSTIVGDKKIKAFGYVVSDRNVLNAYLVAFFYISFAFISSILIYVMNSNISIFKILFDVVSGITTTGFSTGALMLMNPLSVFIIAILMGIGRIGFTNILAIQAFRKEDKSDLVDYLEKDVTI